MALTVVLRLTDGDDDIVAASVRHYRNEGADRLVLVDESRGDAVRHAFESISDEERAAAEHTRSWRPEGDGWRLDAQGGEFWVATAASDGDTETLASAFSRIARGVGRVDVPAVPLTGVAALSGPGFARLVYRDEQRAVASDGLPPTRTALRAGDEVPHAVPGIEVLRLADRSVEQVRARAGATDADAVGRYLVMAPTPGDVESALADGTLARDERLFALAAEGSPSIASTNEVPLTPERETEELRAALRSGLARLAALERTSAQAGELEAELTRLSGRRVVRAADAATRVVSSAVSRARRGGARVRGTIVDGRRRRSEKARAAAVERLLDRPLPPPTVSGSPSTDAVPVIMCLWNRPGRFAEIVSMMQAQETGRPVRLILWNNAPGHHAAYERQLAAMPSSTRTSVELYRSPANIGGVARFVVARRLWLDGVRGPFIMLDDDQQVGPDFAETMLAEYEPHSISAWWAFGNHGSHWKRSELEPGEPADYAGTGGTIADLDIVADRSFFDLPPRFLMLEDQWMTWFARTRGWAVRKSAVAIEQVMQEESGNQYHALRALKDEFYAYLYANR